MEMWKAPNRVPGKYWDSGNVLFPVPKIRNSDGETGGRGGSKARVSAQH